MKKIFLFIVLSLFLSCGKKIIVINCYNNNCSYGQVFNLGCNCGTIQNYYYSNNTDDMGYHVFIENNCTNNVKEFHFLTGNFYIGNNVCINTPW